LVAWNPVWQVTQKEALKQATQLAEQARHLWLRLSGKNPFPQLETHLPLRRNCPAEQARVGAAPVLMHPPKALAAYPEKQPP
jgi:hypothetical protein